MTTAKISLKSIVDVIKAPPKHWVGNGFHVHSMFTYEDSPDLLSPFLLLDYFSAEEFKPSDAEPRGVGEHPHRGFETVTILHQGEVEHRDSAGHAGKIGPGDVQWMTAASGIVHEEKHSHAFTKKGGVFEGAQLWVNLPTKDKMSKPKYQDLTKEKIPAVEMPNGAGTLRVIAGEYFDKKGPAFTFTPINLWDITLKAGEVVDLNFPEAHAVAILVFHGDVKINGSKPVKQSELALMTRQGETVSLSAQGKEGVTVLLMSGAAIDEPVVGYGPFVMNTHAEIGQAIQDYESGKMGTLEG
ncbi:MAG TPA: pirin family protein [Planctomycetota bacterium]|nr:pirin family protein [Planctomycetota bacterium]